jgi:hypothetical protein
MKRWIVTTALGLAPCAMAQFEDKTCVVFDRLSGQLVWLSAVNLGFKEAQSHWVEANFIAALQSQQWDLVSLELAVQKVQNKALMLSLFEQQLAGGAKFIVSYAHLDEWPELQAFLGVAEAKDVVGYDWVNEPEPGNPMWSGAGAMPPNNPIWDDHGDVLTPGPNMRVIARFGQQGSGEVAALMTGDRTRLCNAWNFDEYLGGSPTALVRQFVEVMFLCEADVNLDGTVNLADFLQFVNWFNGGLGVANRNYDNQLDLFDFLHLVNTFNECVP